MGRPLRPDEIGPQALWFSDQAKERHSTEVSTGVSQTREKTQKILGPQSRQEEIDARRDALEMVSRDKKVLLDEIELRLPYRYPSFKPSTRAQQILDTYARMHGYRDTEAKQYQRWLMEYLNKHQGKNESSMRNYDPKESGSLKEWNLFQEVKESQGNDRVKKNAQLITEQLKKDKTIRKQVLLLLHQHFHPEKTVQLQELDPIKQIKAKKIVDRLVVEHPGRKSTKLALYVYRRLVLENRQIREQKRNKARIDQRKQKAAA